MVVGAAVAAVAAEALNPDEPVKLSPPTNSTATTEEEPINAAQPLRPPDPLACTAGVWHLRPTEAIGGH